MTRWTGCSRAGGCDNAVLPRFGPIANCSRSRSWGSSWAPTRTRALFDHFRRHDAELFPKLTQLTRIHRTTFMRRAVNLWRVKVALWQTILAQVPHDPVVALIDSFPIPVCRFARAYRCRRFLGEAAQGRDELNRQSYYGFRRHVRSCR